MKESTRVWLCVVLVFGTLAVGLTLARHARVGQRTTSATPTTTKHAPECRDTVGYQTLDLRDLDGKDETFSALQTANIDGKTLVYFYSGFDGRHDVTIVPGYKSSEPYEAFADDYQYKAIKVLPVACKDREATVRRLGANAREPVNFW